MPEVSDFNSTRRGFIKLASGGVVALSLSGLLSACSTDATSTSVSGQPRKGGTLRAGLTGGGQADTIDAHKGLSFTDLGRSNALYDGTMRLDDRGQMITVLAESLKPNDTADEWTLKLRPNLKFHDGTPVTAEDVLFSYRRVQEVEGPGSNALTLVDLKNARVVDSLTLKLPCTTPNATLDLFLATNSYFLGIVPKNYDPRRPVGAGPFAYKSFTPGQQSEFTAFDDYWDSKSGPYVDTLIIQNYGDETAQINALRSGQIDVVNQLSSAAAQLAATAGTVQVAQGGGMTPLVMRCDRAPFDDVRVRQALRLVVDREQMNKVVFDGKAKLGNDVFSPLDADYDSSLPQRSQDVARARALLAEAGQSDLTVTLTVAELGVGAVQIAQVFAEQAKAAGVTVKLNKVTVTEFNASFPSWDFSVDTWTYAPYLPMVSLATKSDAPLNETHFQDSRYDSLFRRATEATNPKERAALIREMQSIDYETGGYIIPFFPTCVDAFAKNIQGVKTSKTGASLGNYDFKSMWIA